jgi:hypothetical protein
MPQVGPQTENVGSYRLDGLSERSSQFLSIEVVDGRVGLEMMLCWALLGY